MLRLFIAAAFAGCASSAAARSGPFAAWTSCRASTLPSLPAASLANFVPPRAAACIPGVVPGTALHALLANGTFRDAAGAAITDPFVDELLTAGIPDISATGADFYTFAHTTTISSARVPGCTASPLPAAAVVLLSIAQASYRVHAHLDGAAAELLPVAGGGAAAAGMYQRFDYALGAARAFCGVPQHGLAALVLPPDHPGNATSACKGCGQGGDHMLAQDVTSQSSAGWDWQGGIADRNTGLLDEVAVAVVRSGVLLRDGAAVVSELVLDADAPTRAASLRLRFRVSLLNLGGAAAAGRLSFALPALGIALSQAVAVPADGAWLEVDSAAPGAAVLGAELWWPHTLGPATLYNATASFVRDDDATARSAVAWRAGLRTVTSAVDPVLGGRVFAVNSRPLYICGGNYITSDALSRASFRTAARYGAEVRAHVEMGLNVLRLWGGTGGAAAALWDAADAQGVMLFQEFFMTGDNNGRWAGSASWPLDHPLYLSAVADTLRATRGRASLLLYCGGNELFPLDASPPPDILAGMLAALAALDPARAPFTQSSMGSKGGGMVGFDAERILAPNDGDYGINNESLYWRRNPGIRNGSSLLIAFQPEIGNVGAPDYESLARFLSPPLREDVPPPHAGAAGSVAAAWVAHDYLPFTDGDGRDHVYELLPAAGPPPNASEYSRAAGMAQHAQYQALFEGFQERIFEWYGAVIMWKSASPWPSLRGALFDWFLAPSGGYWGARAANEGGNVAGGGGVHIQLNRDASEAGASSMRVTVLNHGLRDARALLASVAAYDIASGAALALAPFNGSVAAVPSATAVHLPQQLAWPADAAPGAPLLWRLELHAAAGARLTRSEYWLTSLSVTTAQDWSALAPLRAAGPRVALAVAAAAAAAPRAGAPLAVTVNISCPAGGAVALAVRVSLRNPATAVTAATGFKDDRVLPSYPDAGYFSLIPGELRSVVILADTPASVAGMLVVVDAWNADASHTLVAFP